MDRKEIDYLRRRADEEAAAALNSADLDVARIHSNLAALYNRKIVDWSLAAAVETPDQLSIRSR